MTPARQQHAAAAAPPSPGRRRGHLGRRRFLTVTGAAAALAFADEPARRRRRERRRARRPEDRRGPLHARRRLRRPAARLRPAVDPARAPPLRAGQRPARRARHRPAGRSPTTSASAASSGRGSATAHPEFNHTVHVEVDGLDADRVYYYRFRDGQLDQPDRPHPHRARRRQPGQLDLTLAAVSCQAYHDGYFTAYQHLAQEDVDVVFHLGDYLYEYAVDRRRRRPQLHRPHAARPLQPRDASRWRTTGCGTPSTSPTRTCAPPTPRTPSSSPGTTTRPRTTTRATSRENGVPPEEFLLRRAAAYRAYWENQPLRRPQRPTGPDMQLYRRLQLRPARPVRHPRHPPVPLRPGVRRRLAASRARSPRTRRAP